jgi:hypothetical protein
MHFPSVILSGVGAHATTQSKDPDNADFDDADSGNFCDAPSLCHSERSEESAVPTTATHFTNM